MRIYVLTASGGEYSDSWDDVLGVFRSVERAKATAELLFLKGKAEAEGHRQLYGRRYGIGDMKPWVNQPLDEDGAWSAAVESDDYYGVSRFDIAAYELQD